MNKNSGIKHLALWISLICALLFQSACADTLFGRSSKANGIAASARMLRTQYIAPPFTLTGWQRLSKQDEPVNIYIEGDGLAWLSRSTPSLNPTPKDPIALTLASKDRSPNVVYLARPCQYTALDDPDNAGCSDHTYWTGKRFAPEIINAYMHALDTIKTKSGTTEFHITGYSGGANIAGLLAAARTDVTMIRTVAGNIDNHYFTQYHKVSTMPDSLNMADHAEQLADTPQLHLIGAEDDMVPPHIYRSYALKAGASPCISHRVIPDIQHEKGWDKLWPLLLTLPPPSCEPPYSQNNNDIKS